jgi:addiction module HigA family antidote
MTTVAKSLTPIHPGETTKLDIIEPLGMSVNQLAKALAVDAARLNDIVRGRRGISADTALRLAVYLGTTPQFWIGLQLDYELRLAQQERLRQIQAQVKPRNVAA